jgi:Autotransporter beta-domain/Autochaperone Domain Type 1
MRSRGQRRVPFNVCRKFWLMAASALAPLSLGVSEPALGQLGCTGTPSDTVCTPAGNSYSSGISVDTTALLNGFTNPIKLTLTSGVIVDILAGAGGVNAVNAANSTGVTSGSANIAIIADGVTISNTANPLSNNNTGLRIQSSGAATITATNTTINVAGTASDWAILAFAMPNLTGTARDVSVNWSGPSLTSATSIEGGGIQADNRYIGNASVVASGNINVAGVGNSTTQYGLLAHAGDPLLAPSGAGDASVTYNSGVMNVNAIRPRGILAWVQDNGSATATTAAGTVINVSGTERGGPGVYVYSGFGTATAANKLTATVASEITSSGPETTNSGNLPAGIRAVSGAGAQIDVTYTGPGITTHGGNGTGITALSSGIGSITVNSSGPINTTNGSNAVGILADSSGAILRRSPGLLTDVQTINPVATAITGSVQVNTSKDVLAQGQFGTGISATSGSGGVTVNVQGGSVIGGWQADLTSVGTTYGLQATGIFLSSAASTLTNNGFIGALSDRAVAGDPVVINYGTIEGFVQFTGGNNSILNNGTFNLRHFADTNGDGVRDTVRVAIADLGAGFNNSFTNNGTLALSPLSTTPIVSPRIDSTGEYLPLGNPNNTMAFGGPLQGHLIGVQTFTNSGIIDLQSNPVAGDVLVITGARQAGLVPTQPIAGLPGPGTFISNGGTLRLDTVLNEGGAATRSDTLVVDGTSVGPGGPTSMAIRNAGGAGALTVGNGILVVQVLAPTLSASGAFSLQGGSITEGAFDYFLFKGGATQGSQGNWYLRNTLIAPPIQPIPPGELPITPPEAAPGTPPLPTLAPGAAPIPLFQPGVAVMSVVPSVARTLGLITLGTFNERQGDQLLVRGGCSRETQNRAWEAGKSITGDENCITRIGAWGRVFGQHTREHFAQGARPDFDGTFAGFQTGADLLRFESINGHSDHVGFYVAQARASGSVHGSVDGFEGALAGHVDLDASSYGGYWTHLGPSNWYIDTVIQGTHYIGTPNSIRGVSTTVNGDAFAGSIEAGYPIHLGPYLSFEPQIQGIWQRVWLYDTLVPVATITFDRADVFTGRAGALLRGTFGSCGCAGAVWQPYLKGNVWWGSNGFDTVYFNSFGIPTGRNGGTTLEGGGGVTGKLTRNVSVYGDASYLTAVSGESLIALKGNVGLRVTW